MRSLSIATVGDHTRSENDNIGKGAGILAGALPAHNSITLTPRSLSSSSLVRLPHHCSSGIFYDEEIVKVSIHNFKGKLNLSLLSTLQDSQKSYWTWGPPR